MTNPTIRIHNTETNEIIDREMTAAELKQYEAEKQIIAGYAVEADAKTTQRQALLNRLGITEEEARILLGGN
jgi:hypothetical protein